MRLVTEPIDKITPFAVATTDGESHEIDVLVLATGFKVWDTDNIPTFAVTGSGGRSLSRFWDDHRLQACGRVSVPGSRRCSPCSARTATSARRISRSLRCSPTTSCDALKRARRDSATRVEVTEKANDRYFAEVMRKRHRQIFWQDSCRLANSYYFDKNGDVPLRPTTTL